VNDLIRALREATPSLGEGESLTPESSSKSPNYSGFKPSIEGFHSGGGERKPAQASSDGSSTPKRWSIYDEDGNGTWKCNAGKVWRVGTDGTLSEESIADANAELSISAGQKLFLSCTDSNLADLTLETGSVSYVYEQSGGNLTNYRYILGDITSTDPGLTGISLGNVSGTNLYYRSRVGDYDLKPNAVYLLIDAEPVWGVEFGPY